MQEWKKTRDRIVKQERTIIGVSFLVVLMEYTCGDSILPKDSLWVNFFYSVVQFDYLVISGVLTGKIKRIVPAEVLKNRE